MEMETKRLLERLGEQHIEDHSTTAVQAIFRDRHEPLHEQIRTKGSYAIAAIAGAVVAMAVLGMPSGGVSQRTSRVPEAQGRKALSSPSRPSCFVGSRLTSRRLRASWRFPKGRPPFSGPG